jgi:hypothetical protein
MGNLQLKLYSDDDYEVINNYTDETYLIYKQLKKKLRVLKELESLYLNTPQSGPYFNHINNSLIYLATSYPENIHFIRPPITVYRLASNIFLTLFEIPVEQELTIFSILN